MKESAISESPNSLNSEILETIGDAQSLVVHSSANTVDEQTSGQETPNRTIRVEDALREAGGSNTYQYRVLLMLSLQFTTLSFLCISTPFLYLPPQFVLKSDPDQLCPEELRCTDACEMITTNMKNSLSVEFGIMCHTSFYLSLQGSIFFAGGSLSVLLISALVDRYGRRKPLYFTLLLTSIFAIASSYATSIEMFMILFGVVGVFSIPFIGLCYVLLGESGDRKFGGKATGYINSCWGLAEILFVLIAYKFGDWRFLTRWIIGIPMFVSTFGFLWILNPPKYLYSRKKYNEARDAIIKIAKVNRRKVNTFSFHIDNEESVSYTHLTLPTIYSV
eukprot:TRINITY_DN1192_c0_g2_i2.p1 TRINITY_DN1192_c0_g2~~TRINITY_DN1192_c0_g2_i2.p1  ORF type:complete len:334 (-),score=30.63 TRINITY_DN1192_c0_g2_i2:17-1018(-)